MEKNSVVRLAESAAKSEPEWKRFFAKNKKKLEKMDVEVHRLHDEISAKTDCLTCANCCRTLGPRIEQKDIERIAKTLRIKEQEVVERYLRVDEDGDWVFQSMPCPFLGTDNYCAIYDSRPKACREYPHTNRKRFYQIYHLSMKNAQTCPIVFEVLERLSAQEKK
jgi:Predicted Fe-S-cluster oxidoreductase